MKYFLILAAAILVLLASAMTVKPRISSWYSERTPEDVAHSQVSYRAYVAHSLHREYMLADSLIPLLSDPSGITIGITPDAVDSPDTLRMLATTGLNGIQPRKARFGMFVVDMGYGRYTSVKEGGGGDRYNVFTGVDSAGAYCAVVVGVTANRAREARSEFTQVRRTTDGRMIPRMPNPVGPCRIWAAYGAPGPAIDQWLRNGGYYFAGMPASALTKRDTSQRRGLFGRVDHDIMDARAETCLTRDTEACVAVFMAPQNGWRSAGHFAAVAGSPSNRSGVLGSGDDALVAKLEEQFGKEKFEAFWKSSLPVDQAFVTAFGVELGPWLHDITDTYYVRRDPGPRMNGSTWLLTLVLIAALVGTSWILAQRRQIA